MTAYEMRHQRALAALELVIGVCMFAGFFAILAAPALARSLVDLTWALRTPAIFPRFGLNPHLAAEAQFAPPLIVLLTCAGLALGYRWLTTRRRE
jgi:hypothetical protein